ncbi:RNA polymerase sigma factor [Winogradskya humida]|uniref:RNA polymerase sigma factor n=2 Tax=Winogradskya humida TaxID=113566 RepID=A0ABQ3ZXG0_9ACTN|nr:RNA polymerase sigma factor [Actinoplanes humidus]
MTCVQEPSTHDREMPSTHYREMPSTHYREMGDRMTALHAGHSRDVMRYLLVLTRGERHTAEDLLQETMLRAWRHIGVLPRDDESARRWLFTVARRLVIDAVRMRRTRPAEIGLVDFTWIPGADDTTASALATHSMKHAFNRLSPAHRDILSEVYLRGSSTEEIAEKFGLPVGTVKSRAHYALRALKTALA